MADTTTTNYRLIMPGINDPAGDGTWGGKINSNMQSIDSALGTLAGQISSIGSGGGGTGQKGDKGDPGKDGAQGLQGQPGKDGQDGAPGKDGAPGPTGSFNAAPLFPSPIACVASPTNQRALYQMYNPSGLLMGSVSYQISATTISNTIGMNNAVGGGYCAVQGDGTFVISSSTAYKPGGGAWAATSDARIKNVLGDYDLGLDAVIQLRPVVYRYKGNDGDGPFVGLIAQEVEDVMPDMVSMKDGEIDGERVDDLRVLDTSELQYAMVNAIRTLSARVQALEAALAVKP